MSAPPTKNLLLDRPSDGVALVTIDRADRFNTLSAETLDELDATLLGLSAAPDVRAVVLTGAGGGAFAAGAHISELAALEPRGALAFAARGQRAFGRLERAPQATIAAIRGYCMGGGLDLALACDIRHASLDTVFAHPGARLGILTGFGGTARLARLVGRARAAELFATARRIGADEALAMGLVDRVAPDPLASALAVAAEIAEKWPESTAFVKGSAVRWWRRAR